MTERLGSACSRAKKAVGVAIVEYASCTGWFHACRSTWAALAVTMFGLAAL